MSRGELVATPDLPSETENSSAEAEPSPCSTITRLPFTPLIAVSSEDSLLLFSTLTFLSFVIVL